MFSCDLTLLTSTTLTTGTVSTEQAVSKIEKTFMGFSLEKLFTFLIIFGIAY